MKFKKIIKFSLAMSLVFGAATVLSGCDKDNSSSKGNDKKYEIYKLAKEAGVTDLTYEEWLVSIKGNKGDKGEDGHTPIISIGTNGNWVIDGVDTEVKATGATGDNGNDGASWLVGTISPNNNGKNGDFYFNSLTQKIYRKENNVWIEKATISDGRDGVDGKQIEIKTTESYIQWRYVGESTWNNLIALSELKGEGGDDGKEIELQTTSTHIQWRYADGEWQDLVSLESLKGQKGEDGKDGTTWLTGEGEPNTTAKIGDFYFDTLNDDIYLYTDSGWILEVDLNKKEVETEFVLEEGTYTGLMKGFEFTATVEKDEEYIVTELLLNGDPAVNYGVTGASISVDGKIINITITVSDSDEETIDITSKMILKGENTLVPFVDDEELSLLKGVYQNYDLMVPKFLTLGENTFALSYNYIPLKGTYEIVYADEVEGVYGLTLTSGDKVINVVVDYFYRSFYMTNIGDFENVTYNYNGDTLVYTSGESVDTLKIGDNDPVEVTNVTYFEIHNMNYLHIETESNKYLLDYFTGEAYDVQTSDINFVGSVYYVTDANVTYVFSNYIMEFFEGYFSTHINDYDVTVDLGNNEICISEEIEPNMGMQTIYQGSINDFAYNGESGYFVNIEGLIVNITLNSDGSIADVTVSEDSNYNPGEEQATKVDSEESFRDALNEGVNSVMLENDIEFTTTVDIRKNLTIDLNGHNISAPTDTYGDGIFHVFEGGLLTINGDGIINSVGNNNYSIAIWADGGEVIINGGTYTNVGAGSHNHYDLIYVKNGGTITINNGTFICQTSIWTLNSNNEYRGTIIVNGGRYLEFNPKEANTDDFGAENNPVNYLGDNDFIVNSETDEHGTWYVVNSSVVE